MLQRLLIENYRSIQSLDLPLDDINAFIGANSSGKSNILRALNLVIGSTYATIKSFDDCDYYQKNKTNHILIDLYFSQGLTCDNQVYGFRLQCDGIEANYIALGHNHHPLTYFNSREKKVTNEMREEVSLMYITLDRLSYQQIKPSQWTIYGKLLKFIANSIQSQHKTAFLQDITNTYTTNLNPYITTAEQHLQNYVREQTGKQINLRMSIIDPTMLLKELRPRITDANGLEVDVDEEGAGVQSAVAIAIARTFATVTNLPIILAIEEPELFLHPHACRHFYKLLKELSTHNVQIFYTTHERSFVNIADYQYIKLVKKDSGDTTVNGFNGRIPNFDAIKAASKFDDELNEVFFASKVVLVEGPADKIAVKSAFETMTLDLDKANVSVVECGSISGIKPMVEILNRFQIECFALVDEDPGNATTAATTADILTVLSAANLFVQRPGLEGIFGVTQKFKKETALRDIPVYYQTNPVQQIYLDIRTALNL